MVFQLIKRAGANFLRGGAYKPRTSPYSIQGMEEDGLKLLADAKAVSGLPIVTEIMNPREIDLIIKYAPKVVEGIKRLKEWGEIA